MPRRAFDSQIPDKVYIGVAANLVSELAERRGLAREESVASYLSTTCGPLRSFGPHDRPTDAVPREAIQIPLDTMASVVGFVT